MTRHKQQPRELDQLHAEVARVLRADPPDAALLMATLERVELMLQAACIDLTAVIRNLPGTARLATGED